MPGTEKRLGFIGDVYETANAARMVFYTRDEAGNLGERLTVLGNGNLGIGTTTPAYKMDVSDRIRIRSGVNSTAGLWLNNPGNSATIAFMGVKDVDVAGIYGNVSGWGLLMNTNTGAVGIGYQNPVAGYRLSVLGNQYIDGLVATTGDAEIGGTLHVNGLAQSGGLCYAYFQPNSICNDILSGIFLGVSKYSINSNGAVLATEFDAYSDARIKNITGISNAGKDLEIINGLYITDYTMKDKVKYGNQKFKKVIAQEVEKIYPQVVSKHTDFIPNVYQLINKLIKTTDGYLLSFNTPHNISKAAKKLQVLMEGEGSMQSFDIVSIPSANEVIINATEIKGDKVFVYGEEVDDFRTVDYEGLTTLNISATQELSKLINEQNKKIAILTEEIKLLKEKPIAALQKK